MKNIYAMTEATGMGYPAYVSLNAPEDGGLHVLTVRSRGNYGRDTGTISLTRQELRDLANRILVEVGPA